MQQFADEGTSCFTTLHGVLEEICICHKDNALLVCNCELCYDVVMKGLLYNRRGEGERDNKRVMTGIKEVWLHHQEDK